MAGKRDIVIVGIAGLGLIGGSMAKTIKKKTGHRVLGADINRETMAKALLEGAVDGELNRENMKECNILMMALCPQALIRFVGEHQDDIAEKTLVVDLCGVKRCICDAVIPTAREKGFCFIGGHPMAGMEKGGFDNAEDRLFRRASMILVPGEDVSRQVCKELETFFLSLGFGKIQYASAEEHDRIIAYTSQLAHVLSSAYVKTPTALSHAGFSAGSFKDMTRVATLDEDMWTELFVDNADYLAAEVEGLIQRLIPYAEALRGRNETVLRELLKEGRVYKAKTLELAK